MVFLQKAKWEVMVGCRIPAWGWGFRKGCVTSRLAWVRVRDLSVVQKNKREGGKRRRKAWRKGEREEKEEGRKKERRNEGERRGKTGGRERQSRC